MQKQKISTDDAAVLVLILAIIFGTWLRIMPAWIAGFPINDGGMFYTMIEDLQDNHYSLPLFTSYNQLHIPFVYPPLGFYIGAAITDLFKLPSPLPVIQWLPGILNSLCIPAFYLFAKEVTGNKLQAAFSSLVFSLIPHMTAWFSMGGGLTRALGAIFMLFALTHIHRVFAKESKQDIWAAIIFSSLAVISHTEAPIYTISIAIYIWMMKSRSVNGLRNGILVAAGVLLLISPWLMWIMNSHGLTPIISASQTGLRSTWSVLKLLNIDILTEEPYLDLLGAMGIIGMTLLVAKKSFFIPGMFVVIFLSHPRSAHTIGNIPLAIAAGFFISQIFIPLMQQANNDLGLQNKQIRYGVLLSVLMLFSYVASNSLFYGNEITNKHVAEPERNAMQWIVRHTPGESSFLIITGEPNGFCDSISEWFPTLTKRQSIATLQGNEWLKNENFKQFAIAIQNIQSCGNEGLDCILQASKMFSKDFDYLYISLKSPTLNCKLNSASPLPQSLILELEKAPQFQSVFRSSAVVIFQKNR